jgi:nucleoid-associated protein YgaU
VADLEQLKQKYAPVVAAIQSFSDEGAQLQGESLDGEKLYLKATVPSQVVLNRLWDAIKQCDPQYADLHHEIVPAGQEQKYTIKSGDNLSKISQRFYGSANRYQKIAEANHISDPDHIRAGQEITLPVLS